MKELYTAPKAELTCFAPAEKLASISFDFDDLWEVSLKDPGTAVDPSDKDLNLDL